MQNASLKCSMPTDKKVNYYLRTLGVPVSIAHERRRGVTCGYDFACMQSVQREAMEQLLAYKQLLVAYMPTALLVTHMDGMWWQSRLLRGNL